MTEYIQKYGPGIAKVTESIAPPPSWKVEDSAALIQQMDEMVPAEKLPVKKDCLLRFIFEMLESVLDEETVV